MECLQITWFALWGILWAAYFMLDGFVLGTGMVYPVLGGSDGEKRALINSVGPVWNGNEVWLITAGGATFAAFPTTYALMFSYLYTALLLLLVSLIIRGVSLEFRGKHDSPAMETGLRFRDLHFGLPGLFPVRGHVRQHFQGTAHGFIRISRGPPLPAEPLRTAHGPAVRPSFHGPWLALRGDQDAGGPFGKGARISRARPGRHWL